jgi:hypothetical protein
MPGVIIVLYQPIVFGSDVRVCAKDACIENSESKMMMVIFFMAAKIQAGQVN